MKFILIKCNIFSIITSRKLFKNNTDIFRKIMIIIIIIIIHLGGGSLRNYLPLETHWHYTNLLLRHHIRIWINLREAAKKSSFLSGPATEPLPPPP